MIEAYNIITGKHYASTAMPVIRTHPTVRRGKIFKFAKARCKYDMCKWYFTNHIFMEFVT